MYINKSNEVTFNEKKGTVYNAVSGDRMLVEKGKPVSNLESQSVEPRYCGRNQPEWSLAVLGSDRWPSAGL